MLTMPFHLPFLRSTRPRTKPRADPAAGPVASCPDRGVRFRPLPKKDVQLDPLDPQTVLSRWRYLGSLNPTSHDYDELLRTLVDAGGNKNVTMKFTDDDAGIVVNVISKALRSDRLPKKLAHHGFIMLRRLAGNTCRLPDNYLVGEGDNFQVEEKIFACGGFADIRKGTLAEKVVAVKTIRIAEDSDFPKIQKDFCKESVLWMHISHPNVLELTAVNIDPQSRGLSMISEFMERGNVMDYIRTNEANRIRLLDDVAKGLSYLHKCDVVHGDLKGTNILIKNGAVPQACISDFGFSTLAPAMSFVMTVTGDECKGTCSHMAPELLYPKKFNMGSCLVSKQADVYAFGMVVYEVLTGRPPFWAEKRRAPEIMFYVMSGKRPRKPENARDIGFGEGTWELVQQCWNEDRGKRPMVEEISEHFQRVAKKSSIILPGPTTSVYEAEAPTASEPDTDSRHFTRLFDISQRGANIVQQARLAAGLMNSGGFPAPFSAPSMQLVHTRPSFFERIGARIIGRKSGYRIGAPKPPPART